MTTGPEDLIREFREEFGPFQTFHLLKVLADERMGSRDIASAYRLPLHSIVILRREPFALLRASVDIVEEIYQRALAERTTSEQRA